MYLFARYTLLLGSLFLVGCNGLTTLPDEQGDESNIEPSVSIEPSTSDAKDLVPEPLVIEEQSTAVQKTTTSVDEVVQIVAPQVKEVQKVAEAGTSLVAPRPNMTPTNRVELWLAQADLAMQKDQLTTPANNNAYALYARVLMQDEENKAALQGLERIVQRYLSLAVSSHKKGKAANAKLFLQRASKVVPGHRDIAKVTRQLAKMPATVVSSAEEPLKETVKTQSQKKQEVKPALKLTKYQPIQTLDQSILEAPLGMQKQRILIPVDALKDEASALAVYLRGLARQIEEVDGRLYIIAPRDNQVRWVYGLLNGVNPDYRIRANIKHKSPAAIEVIYQAEQPLLDVFH